MTATFDELGILRLPQVIQLVGLRRTTIYEMMEKGIFPRSISLGARAIGWRVGDIRRWLEARRKTQ